MDAAQLAQSLKLARDAVRDAILEALAHRDTPKYKLQGASPVLSTSLYQLEAPTAWEFCCKWTSTKPLPVDLISFPQFVDPSNGNTPPPSVRAKAGSTANIAYHSHPCGIYRIICGAGPDPRVLYCDLRDGRFALGPQTYVEVHATLYGTATLNPALFDPIIVHAAVGESDGSGDYLSYSIPVVLIAGGTVGALEIVPPGARFVNIGVRDATIGTSTLRVRSTIGNVLQRDYETPEFFPGLGSPVPVNASLMNFSNYGATALTLSLPGYIEFWCSG